MFYPILKWPKLSNSFTIDAINQSLKESKMN